MGSMRHVCFYVRRAILSSDSELNYLSLVVPRESIKKCTWPYHIFLLFSIFQCHPGFGTSDGTFLNQRYFWCPPQSGVFVGLDKLAPFEDDNSELRTPSKSRKRDDHGQVNFKSRLDSVFPSFLTVTRDLKLPQPRHFDTLKIDQRVVVFYDKGAPLRGTVRYTGDVEDSSGHVQSVVGLELVGYPQSRGFTADCIFF